MNQSINALSLPIVPQPLTGIRLLVRDLRRQLLWLVLLPIVGFLGGVVLAIGHAPRFLAEARLIVENIHLDASRQEMVPTSAFVDSSLVDSQVEILKSPSLMLRTIDDLKLRDQPDYARLLIVKESSFRSLLRTVFPSLDASSVASRDRESATLVQVLQERLTVRRIGQSTVVTVSFVDDDPEQAAAIVNSLVKAYQTDQSTSAASFSSSVSAWLRDRVKDLGPRSRVVSWALPPAQRQGPKTIILVAACTLAATALGTLLAMLGSGLNGRLRDPVQASLVVPGAYLGSLPVSKKAPPLPDLVQARREGTGSGSGGEVLLSSHLHVRSDGTFRAIMAGAMRDGAIWSAVLGVTATRDGEGVTTVATHLAAAAARAGFRVLLVEGNAERPTLSRAFGATEALGMTDLTGSDDEMRRVCMRTDVVGLDIMFAGRRAKTMTAHHRAERLLHVSRAMRGPYDAIVVDLPSLTSSLDVSLAAQSVDAFVHVVRWNATGGALTDREITLAGVGEKYLGFVFNRQREPVL